jgi:hypothetical protein
LGDFLSIKTPFYDNSDLLTNVTLVDDAIRFFKSRRNNSRTDPSIDRLMIARFLKLFIFYL